MKGMYDIFSLIFGFCHFLAKTSEYTYKKNECEIWFEHRNGSCSCWNTGDCN